jgi:hypothetical protein
MAAGKEFARNESYQMVNQSRRITVSEQSDTHHAPQVEAASAVSEAGMVESPAIAPDHEAPKADAPKVEPPKIEAPKAEAPKIEVSKAGAPGATGKVLIMAPGDRSWRGESGAKTQAGQAPAQGKRRFAAMAAVAALATIAGAAGGVLATMGVMHTADAAATAPASGALEAAIARVDADMLALKAGLDHTSKMALTQFNKTSDRLDRIEKAQAEPTAKLAKLSEALERLRATPAPVPVVAAAPTPVAPKEVTGSVTPPVAATAAPAPAAAPPTAAPASATPPRPEVGHLPTVDGWYLADVGYGGALIRNRRGTFEVYAGDYIPGLGRIDAIRKQDGHWVVVTSKGLVVARQ